MVNTTTISPLGGRLLQDQRQVGVLTGVLRSLEEATPAARPALEREAEGIIQVMWGRKTSLSQPRLVRLTDPSTTSGFYIPHGRLVGDFFLTDEPVTTLSWAQDTFSPDQPTLLAVHPLNKPSPKTHWYVRSDHCYSLPDASPDGPTRIIEWQQHDGHEPPSFVVTSMPPHLRGLRQAPGIFTKVEADAGILRGMIEVFGAKEVSCSLDLPIGIFVVAREEGPKTSAMVLKGKLYHVLRQSDCWYLGEALQLTDEEFLRLDQASPNVLQYFDRILADVGLKRGPLEKWSPPATTQSRIPLTKILDTPQYPQNWLFTQKDARKLVDELAKRGIRTVHTLLERYYQLAKVGIKDFKFLPSALWHHAIHIPDPPVAPAQLKVVEEPKKAKGK